MKVEDKRFWAKKAEGETDDDAGTDATPAPDVNPAEVEALRRRAEGAERKLQDVQAAFLAAKADLDATRDRLARDADRKVELRFGDLVAELLESVDDLDRALEHASADGASAPLRDGVAIARDRFLAALQKAGVERIDPAGESYDPNVAEAIGVVPVSDPAAHDRVMNVARAGYRLGGRIIRPARVLVGRLVS